jgi:hypothetical protein
VIFDLPICELALCEPALNEPGQTAATDSRPEWRGLYLNPLARFMQKNSMTGLHFSNERFSRTNVREEVAEAWGIENAPKKQTKDLTEHGQQLSPRKVMKSRELVLSELFRLAHDFPKSNKP